MDPWCGSRDELLRDTHPVSINTSLSAILYCIVLVIRKRERTFAFTNSPHQLYILRVRMMTVITYRDYADKGIVI